MQFDQFFPGMNGGYLRNSLELSAFKDTGSWVKICGCQGSGNGHPPGTYSAENKIQSLALEAQAKENTGYARILSKKILIVLCVHD